MVSAITYCLFEGTGLTINDINPDNGYLKCPVCGDEYDPEGNPKDMAQPQNAPDTPELDTAIAPLVRYLRRKGIDTFESCEGGPDHVFPWPIIRFRGDLIKRMEAFNYLRHIGAPMIYIKKASFVGYPPAQPNHGETHFFEIEFEYPLPDFSHLDNADSINNTDARVDRG